MPVSQAPVKSRADDIASQQKRISSKPAAAANLSRFNLALLEAGYKMARESIYRGVNVKVSLVCPNDHLYSIRPLCFVGKGTRCPACRDFRSPLLERYPEDKFNLLLDVLKSRGDTLSPGAVYRGNHKIIDITCKNGHSRSVTPGNYKRGASCNYCRGRHPDQVKQRFFEVLKDRESILPEGSVYANGQTHLLIQCKQGHVEKKTPESYMAGFGCRACSGKCSKEAALNIESLIVERGYSKGPDYKYVTWRSKINLICNKGHSISMAASSFRRGSGCSQCAITGFNQGKPATLYYVKFIASKNREVYKIGITNLTVDKRYSYLPKPKRPQVLKEFYSLKGLDVMNAELNIKRQFSEFKCKDSPIKGLSNTEIFDVDISKLSGFSFPSSGI